MKKNVFKERSEVWLYPGMSGWHFVSIAKKNAKDIKDSFGKHAKGFGSLPVTVTVGKTSWDTSIFPDKRTETYLLPIKASVRKAEGIMANETISFQIKIR